MRAVAGPCERELARGRGRLVEFVGERLGSMKRKDQRRCEPPWDVPIDVKCGVG
jgi:hypothetical protein